MMTAIWTILVIFFTSLELSLTINSRKTEPDSTEEQTEEFPLSKSLGYSINKRLGQIKKITGDDHLSQEYAEQYFDMIRVSRESFEKFDGEEERRPRRLVGSDNLIAREGVPNKRRSASRFRSAVGKRRLQSQASRREKLKNQSMRSHLIHTKNVLDYSDDSELNLKYIRV